MPILADSADASCGPLPLSTQHAADAFKCANDLHNAMHLASTMVGTRLNEGLLKRAVTLSVLRRLGCHV